MHIIVAKLLWSPGWQTWVTPAGDAHADACGRQSSPTAALAEPKRDSESVSSLCSHTGLGGGTTFVWRSEGRSLRQDLHLGWQWRTTLSAIIPLGTKLRKGGTSCWRPDDRPPLSALSFAFPRSLTLTHPVAVKPVCLYAQSHIHSIKSPRYVPATGLCAEGTERLRKSERLCTQIICLLLEGCREETESIEWAWTIWTQHLSTQRRKAPRCSTNTLSSFLTQWHLVSFRTQIMPPPHRDLPRPPHMNKTPPSLSRQRQSLHKC